LNGAGCRLFVVACIPVFDEERAIDGVVIRSMRCMDGFE